MTTLSERFPDAIRRAGLTPPDVIEPERFYRFPGVGKRNGNTAGWCKLFADGVGGVFGDFASGLSETWQTERASPRTRADGDAFRQEVERNRAEAEAVLREEQARAADLASAIWSGAPPADDDSHP